ncbi:helix-turn-helix domain-containing protein [Chloroflexi bacterium TSY]|nr:helix-turn-helix domain-containing protein [Chloroflexi bacterium TSY]
MIQLSNRQRCILERLVYQLDVDRPIVVRAQIILLAAQNMTNQAIAQHLDIASSTVSRWRRRWAVTQNEMSERDEQNLRDEELRLNQKNNYTRTREWRGGIRTNHFSKPGKRWKRCAKRSISF